MRDAARLLMLTAALGCGTVGGAFFAFSTFVMKGLGRLPAPQAIAAMQAVNVAAVTPVFMTALFGTAAACLATAIACGQRWGAPGASAGLAGSLCFLAGAIVVTLVANVPRNDALAAIDPASAAGARLWSDYLRSWTAWNHVRTVASLAAAALLTWSLVASSRR
jgi:uncharacterized membrane protein